MRLHLRSPQLFGKTINIRHQYRHLLKQCWIFIPVILYLLMFVLHGKVKGPENK
jgi:hypothetical protein